MSKVFTPEELSEYDGKDGKPVYLSLQGQVFDVSEGRSFYGPGGPYEAFAGKECARALALMKMDDAELNDNLEGLDAKCLETLQDWVKKFTQKYKLIGKVSNSGAGSPARLKATSTVSPELARSGLMIAVGVAVCAVTLYYAYTVKDGF